ncbi:hypothetical protein CLOM_g12944 [Closterium sp. NIES-68]|nr:hypothetical protein CLOM_g12944 [Closterium sp. NIES-68]
MNPNPNDRRDDGHGAPSDALKAPVAGEGLAADATAIREWRDRQKLVEIVARDGHHWLKYGEKPLMRTGIIRAYYRCGFTNKGAGCPAKKTIDRNPDAVVTEENVQVSYSNNHNHQKEQPPQPAERPASIPKAGSEAERQRNPTLKGEASAAGALAAAPASPSAASSRSSARAAVSAAVTNTAATSVAARPTIDSSAARQQRERSELQQSNTARDSSRVHEVITPKAALSSRLIASAPLSPCSATSAPASALSAGAVPISGEILRGRTNPFGSHLVVPSSSNLRKRPFEITQCGGAAAVTAAAAAATCGGGANFTASAAAAAASAAAAAATHTHSPLTGPPQSTHGLTSSFSFPVWGTISPSLAVAPTSTAAPTVPDTALATGAPAPTAPTTSPATDALAPATAPATGALDPATAPFSASAATGAWGPRALSDAGNSAPPGNHAAVAVVVNRSASVGDIAVATRSGPAGGTVTVTLPSGNTSSRSASYSSPASVQTNTAGLDNGLALPDQARQQKLPPQQQQQQQQQQPGSLEWQEQSKCGRLGLRRVFSDDGSWQVQSFGEQAVGEPISEECPTGAEGIEAHGMEGVRKAEQVREVQSTWETQEVLDLQGCEENQEKAQRMQPMQQPMQQHEMEGQACSACMHAHHPVGPILDPISNQLGTLLQQGIPLLHVPHLPFLPKHSSLAPLSAAPASQAAHWQANPPINSYPLNPLPALTPGAAAAVAGAAAGGGFASIESGTEGYPQEYPMTGLAATSLAPASSAAAAAAPSSAASAAAPSSAASAATAATSFHPPVTLPAFSASGFGEGKSGSSLPTGFPAACAYNARDLVEVAAAGANMEEAESRKPPPSGHSIDDLVTMLPGVIPDIRSNGFPDISVATAEPEDLDLARVILRQIEQQERSMAGGKGGEGGSGSGLGIGAGSEAVVGTAEQQHFPAEQNQRMHDRLDRSSSPPKDLSSRIAVAAALAIAIASSRPNSTSGSRGEGEGGTAQNQAVITAAAAASARQSIRDAAAAPSSVSYLAGGAAASAVDLASLGQAGEECGNKQHHDVFALLGGGDTVSISDFMQDGHDR